MAMNSYVAKRLVAGAIALAMPVVVYFEGYRPAAYSDPVGIPTICFGHTGPEVDLGDKATRAECEALLQGDLGTAFAGVVRCIAVPLAPHEAAALTSFTFNVGTDALCGSTLARKVNSGAKPHEWCRELDRWIYSRGQRLEGLVKRRAAERRLCEGGAT